MRRQAVLPSVAIWKRAKKTTMSAMSKNPWTHITDALPHHLVLMARCAANEGRFHSDLHHAEFELAFNEVTLELMVRSGVLWKWVCLPHRYAVIHGLAGKLADGVAGDDWLHGLDNPFFISQFRPDRFPVIRTQVFARDVSTGGLFDQGAGWDRDWTVATYPLIDKARSYTDQLCKRGLRVFFCVLL
jgi:hypothetical protein